MCYLVFCNVPRGAWSLLERDIIETCRKPEKIEIRATNEVFDGLVLHQNGICGFEACHGGDILWSGVTQFSLCIATATTKQKRKTLRCRAAPLPPNHNTRVLSTKPKRRRQSGHCHCLGGSRVTQPRLKHDEHDVILSPQARTNRFRRSGEHCLYPAKTWKECPETWVIPWLFPRTTSSSWWTLKYNVLSLNSISSTVYSLSALMWRIPVRQS